MTETTLQTDIIVDIYGVLEDKLKELQSIESDPLKLDIIKETLRSMLIQLRTLHYIVDPDFFENGDDQEYSNFYLS